MISINTLRQAIAESRQLSPVSFVKRLHYSAWLNKGADTNLIKVLTGFRRSGKSHLLKVFSQYLMTHAVAPENIFFLNFENDLLLTINTVKDLRHVWELYLAEIAIPGQPIYIIWDEIQLVESWEKLVRTLYETGKYQINLSGSNSHLLSGELSSSLSGRSLELTITPFSFVEYLEYLRLDRRNYYAHKQSIDRAFMRYLRRGGLPEQFDLDNDIAASYREGLIQKIILDDIAKRYQIDKINILQNLFQFISGNITSTLSLRKIINRLQEQGLEISPTTLDTYIYYWETSFALSKLTKFDYRLSRVFDRTNKYYIVDNIFVPGRTESDEKRLENLVHMELVRRYGRRNVFFGSEANGYEVDFVVKQPRKLLAYQVCFELNDMNFKRETGNLKLITKYTNSQPAVLALRNESTIGSDIVIQPIIEWLLLAN